MTTPRRTNLGRYELVQRLGEGGMATVYLARHAGRDVALKVLEGPHAHRADLRSMFYEEAQLTAQLDHPNIAAVYGVEVIGDELALAMEYVHGVDLAKLLGACLERDELPSYETAIAIVQQAAAALDHAHLRCDASGEPLRLVHRDVSLSNLMVGHDGVVKIVDFGIARSTLSTVRTGPGMVRGKAAYMAPEQCQGSAVDHRADVFALGVVLYELTTGTHCFAGASDLARMQSVMEGAYVAPSAIAADFPRSLEEIIRLALAHAPSARFASCAALRNALAHVLAEHGWGGGVAAVRRTMRAVFGPDVEIRGAADATSSVDIGELQSAPSFAHGARARFARDDEPTAGRPSARTRRAARVA